MGERYERRTLQSALRELADPRGPAPILPACEAALDAGLGARLVELGRAHGLSAPLREVLVRSGVDAPTPELDAEIDDNRLRRLSVTAAAIRFGAALDRAEVPWVAVKGPVVAAFLARPEHRSFNDLDLLVSGRDLGRAISVLVDAGAEEVNRNWAGYLEHGSGEIPVSGGSINIDLHWHLIGLARMRRFFALDIEAMLGRRRRVRLADADVSALDPEDQLIHVALHSAFAGAARYDQLRDIAALAGNDDVDWEVLERRARSFRVARMVGHTLDRAAELLAAPVPAATRVRMCGWARWPRRTLDSGVPRRLDGRKGLVRWIVQGHRDGAGATARAALKLVQMNLAARAGRPPRFDAGDVGGPLYYATDAGGVSARSAYLDYAEAHA